MHEKAIRLIRARIEKILDEWSFENRRAGNASECVCYQENKPCHNTPDLNCFFCYCPEYDLSREQGGCKISSKKGKWYSHPNIPTGKIWDCSDCDYPHKRAVVRKYLRRIFSFLDN